MRVGYRVWATDGEGLYSIVSPTCKFWLGKKDGPLATSRLLWDGARARCSSHNHRGSNVIPTPQCLCGYWTVKEIQNLFTATSPLIQQKARHYIVGTALIWGRIVEYEFGYRSEYAKPEGLYTIPHYAQPTEKLVQKYRAYAVPMDQIDTTTLSFLTGAP